MRPVASPQTPGKLDIALLRKAVRAGSPKVLTKLLHKLEPAELAQALAELSTGDLKVVVANLTTGPRLAPVLRAVPDELLSEMLQSLPPELLALVISRIDADDAARLCGRLDDALRERVFELAGPDVTALVGRLLRYAPHSAGGRMIPRFVAVGSDATVGEAVRAIRAAQADVPLFYLYVVDAGQLVGVASLSQLVKASDETPLRDLMATDVVSVAPDADQEAVARLCSRRNLLAVPVVQDGRLLGLVTIDDVIGVLEQEATEDMYNMAGLSGGDRVFSAPSRSLVKRLPWNALNLGTALLAALVVDAFGPTIAKLVALAAFMPVIAGIGGNTGNQTLTVILRGITLGELEFSSGLRALLKELLVGLGIGVLLGLTTGVIAYLWKGNLFLGVVVLLAMIANLLIAAFVGTAIPLTLKRFGADPALGGSILVTMCTDTLGFLCFLGLATAMMRYLI